MKKLSVVVLLSLLLVSSFGFVSAQGVGSGNTGNKFGTLIVGLFEGLADAIEPVSKYFLGSAPEGDSSAESVAVKFLVFLLVFVFAAAAARRIPLLENNPTSSFLVAAIISILSVRFITTPDLVHLIWLPTTTFAVALTSIIPFVIFFFLIEGFDSSILRKFGWSTYLVIFIFFAVSRSDDLKLGDGVLQNASAIYFFIALLSGCLILFDSKIHAMFRYQGIKSIRDKTKRIQAVNLSTEIDELYKTLARATSPADRTAIKGMINTKETTLKTMYE